MTISERLYELEKSFKAEHTYLTDDDVERLIDKAVGIYLDLSFPFDHSIEAIPETRPRAIQWVRDCMQEILDRNGINARSYSENGLTIIYDSTMISNGLRNRLTPKAGEVV